jgi:hypothetical protein
MYVSGVHFRQKLDSWIESSNAKGCLDRELYRLKRYGTAASIVMIRSGDPHFEEKFYLHSRRTDYVIPLAEQHYLLLYGNTDLAHGLKAVQNLRLHLENDHLNIAITELKEDDHLNDVLKRVLALFLIAIQEGGERMIDDTYLTR